MRIVGNRVLVSPLPVAELSPGGIVLPHGHAGDFKQWWIVESLGTGVACEDLAVGQTVLTETRTTHETLDDGRKIMGLDQIIAKLEPDTPEI
jgi:co-chaperonin GroES (HSP10)